MTDLEALGKDMVAMGVWLQNNIEKFNTDDEKDLIAMTTLGSVKKLKKATAKIHVACMEIKSSFMALEMAKGGEMND